ncbi:MAG TPA: hypothetical protein VF384_01355 [Planctomycetota bacterium]
MKRRKTRRTEKATADAARTSPLPGWLQSLLPSGTQPSGTQLPVSQPNGSLPASSLPASTLLPPALLLLPLEQLYLEPTQLAQLRGHHLLTVGDTLAQPAEALVASGVTEECLASLRTAIERVLHDGLGQFANVENTRDWSTLRVQLLAPLDADERQLFLSLVGIGTAAVKHAALARLRGLSLGALEEKAQHIRALLHDRQAPLMGRLRYEVVREMDSFDGVLLSDHTAPGSLLQVIADATQDPCCGLRLAAFCFPHDFHLHRDRLFGVPPIRFRKLLRELPRLAAPHRLPLPVDALHSELADQDLDVRRGLLLHVLRLELRIAIEIDEKDGEIAMADPRSPEARLQELLLEASKPMQLDDLLFVYRERYRRASRTRLLRRLQHDSVFVMVGPNTWSLRRWHEGELHALTPLVDKVARRICAEGGRHNVASLLVDDKPNDRKTWLVLDRLAADPRVRMLGRGDACPATHNRSQVLDDLLHDFRRAAGDVVLSLFVQNQQPAKRRLVERLLRWNRLFVMVGEDRVDTLSNYPFDDKRMRQLLSLVHQHLERRTGYAQVQALKAVIDKAELGGLWLTPELLADLLRRHGSFEVLPSRLVARRDLGLGASLMRTVRQALREAGHPVTVDDVLRARPDLNEFANCLRELIESDPLVQSPNGSHFILV